MTSYALIDKITKYSQKRCDWFLKFNAVIGF